MSTISNRFFVTALEDGITLHGYLRATASLTQSYNNGVCIPDWSQVGGGPTIYLSLMSGADYAVPDSGYVWKWNGTEIAWASTAADAQSVNGLFQKVANYVPSGYTTAVPAIKIIGNLASSSNVDIDVISFEGTKTMSTAPIPFSASIEVRITEWISGGYAGILSFVDGIADISTENQSVTVYGTLYNESGVVSSGVTLDWYLNEVQITSTDSTAAAYINASSQLVVKEEAVVDYATVRCDFTYNGSIQTTQYVGIDDTQDPEYMYVEHAQGSGNSASLRANGTVEFHIWVGTADDPTPNVSWTTFGVKLLDATGAEIDDDLTSIGIASPTNGYRPLTNYPASGTFQYATITIPYALVQSKGKAITGIILATKS